MNESIRWDRERGVGFYQVTNPKVDDFFEEYKRRENTPVGRALNSFRIDLVNRFLDVDHLPELVLDVGIGNGAFLRQRGKTFGFDIAPRAVGFLKENRLFLDPYGEDLNGIGGITFFDSLEHIERPQALLARIERQFVFVSIPIFRDLAHALGSKHFKPQEHYWYFTWRGLVMWFLDKGFGLHHATDAETMLGREDIWTFVFRRAG